jgi:hypothetical protein
VPAGDTAAFVEAMTIADGNGEADTITLAAGSTYSFTTAVEGNQALPSVNTEMTIVGNGAILERAASAVEEMRILRLAFSANLTSRTSPSAAAASAARASPAPASS